MLDQLIAELASRQYGLFSRHQALGLGITPRIILRRLDAGWWVGVAPGVYSLAGWPDSWRRSLWLAHLDIGPESVVSHESAAALHGLLLFGPGPVTLTVLHGDHQRASRLWRLHQSTDLEPAHVTRVDGLRVTAVARTLFDLAAVTNPGRLAQAIDQAHVSGRCRLTDLQAIYDALRRPGKRGMRRLGRLLAVRGDGYVPPESVLERRLRRVLDDPRLPRATPQYRPPWRQVAEQRVDFAYPEQRVIVEADGRLWHTRMDQMAVDRRRDREAQNHGWRCYRFVWEEITGQADMVRATMIGALRRPLSLVPST